MHCEPPPRAAPGADEVLEHVGGLCLGQARHLLREMILYNIRQFIILYDIIYYEVGGLGLGQAGHLVRVGRAKYGHIWRRVYGPKYGIRGGGRNTGSICRTA